jgi:hypothetical protein
MNDVEERRKTRLLESALERGNGDDGHSLRRIVTGAMGTGVCLLSGDLGTAIIGLVGVAIAKVELCEITERQRRLRDPTGPACALLNNPERITGVLVDRTRVTVSIGQRSADLVIESTYVPLVVEILEERCPDAAFEQAGSNRSNPGRLSRAASAQPIHLPPARVVPARPR